MSAIHGIASAFCPGLGQLIAGEGKEGIKDMATAVGGGVLIGAGTALTSVAAVTATDVFEHAGEELPKAMKFIGQHKKAAAIVGGAIALGGAVLTLVNWFKSVINAGKIEKK